ncbi:MAG: VOC family protein [Parcubacteria group bacterium]|nr:VOC family protein [Parcubacteria group bacterium]
MEELIGDYKSFFQDIVSRLKGLGIDIAGYAISHLGVRTTTFEAYERLREDIKKHCVSYVENEHNGRPISKLLLREPLSLLNGFRVDLIELMPPKPNVPYPPGLEHCGIVIGDTLEEFARIHKDAMSGRQDQGPYCQPYFITFDNGKRVKFYDLSLKDVVEKEGHVFLPVPH